MLLSTTETIEGKRIDETFGLVRGNTIRARHVGRDIMAGLRTLVGGEIKDYTVMLDQARDQAIERMVRQAEAVGANAVIPAPVRHRGGPARFPSRTGTIQMEEQF